MATTLEIIRGIAQAAANVYDGSHMDNYNADGKGKKVGLKREEGDPINDRRVSDGFKVKFSGPILTILYQSECRLKDVAQNGFENEVTGMIAKIASFLKKEYKSVTGNKLTLTKVGDPRLLVQKISNYRSDVCASCDYKIGGLKEVEGIEEPAEGGLDDAVRKFLSLKPNKRPSNDTRKK